MRSKSFAICSCKPRAIALVVAVFKLIFTLFVTILSVYGAVLYRDKPNDYVEGDASKSGMSIALTLIASLCVALLGLHLMLFCALIKWWRTPIRWWTRLMPTMEALLIGGICGFYSLSDLKTIVIAVIWTAFNFLSAYFVRNYGNNLPERSTPLLETKEECDEEKDEDDSSSVKSSSV